MDDFVFRGEQIWYVKAVFHNLSPVLTRGWLLKTVWIYLKIVLVLLWQMKFVKTKEKKVLPINESMNTCWKNGKSVNSVYSLN